jgi:hypothetical protein
MKMAKVKSFDCYAGKVSSKMDDRGARKEAYEEIYVHLIESKENLMKKGMSRDEAEEKALCQMGDAADLGGELDHIHTPKVKLWHILVIILILVLIVTSIYGYYFWQLRIIEKEIKIKNSTEIKSYISLTIANLRGCI